MAEGAGVRKIWGRATSSNVMKVLWLLDELGLPFDRIDVGGPFGGTDTPDYRGMNPTGLVPTLQEDDFVLWESNAILRYLCTTHATKLWPAGPRARANVDRWMDCQQTRLNRPQSALFTGLIRTPPEKRDPAAMEQARLDAASAWSLIEAPLSQGPWIAGAEFSLADIAWGVHVHRWFNMDFVRPELPALRAWYDRLKTRPVYMARCTGPIV